MDFYASHRNCRRSLENAVERAPGIGKEEKSLCAPSERQSFSKLLRGEREKLLSMWLHGVRVAYQTPDQKAVCSNHTEINYFLLSPVRSSPLVLVMMQMPKEAFFPKMAIMKKHEALKPGEDGKVAWCDRLG